MRQKFNDGQEVIYSDFDKAQQALELQLYDRIFHELLGRRSNAFFADSFKVLYVGPTSINVNAGLGVHYDSSQTSPEPQRRPLYKSSTTSLNLSSADPSNPRIDIVTIAHGRQNLVTETRKYKASVAAAVTSQDFTVRTDWLADLAVTTGTPAGSPSAPSTPAGRIKIAEILVAASSGVASQSSITDKRIILPGLIGNNQALDVEVLSSNPSEAPPENYTRLFYKDGALWTKSAAAVVAQVGANVVLRRARITNLNSPYVIPTNIDLVEIDASSGAVVVRYTAAEEGRTFTLKAIDVTNSITVEPNTAVTTNIEKPDGTIGTSSFTSLDEKGMSESYYGNLTQNTWYRR